MIDLRRSRTRAAVVRELFGFPETEIHVRALARVTGEAAANVHRELKRLEREGWVVARRSGNRALYRVAKENPLYPVVSRLVDETVGPAVVLREALARVQGVSLALLLKPEAPVARRGLLVLIVGRYDTAQVAIVLASVGQVLRRTVEPLLFDRDRLVTLLGQHDMGTVRVLEAPHAVLIGDEQAVRSLLALART